MLTKESFLETKNIDSVYNLFAGLGLKCHKTEEGLEVEITDDGNDFVEVHIVSDNADIEKKSRKFRYGCYCRLFISSDYEYWTFTRKTMEDGIRLHKYRFSKDRIRENAKAIPLQKLSSLKFNDLKSFDELFERKDITKKFYDDFKKLIDGFIKEINNIKDPEHTRWYASVLINRLLFIYFIQHKELLGEKDSSYLSNKLKEFAKTK
ncbi:MAG TPA: hypothetical protein PLG41_21905, partial [Leptospiraceae bacterium]|nr:hypothetical protein [Leptospiraceae bacterium]